MWPQHFFLRAKNLGLLTKREVLVNSLLNTVGATLTAGVALSASGFALAKKPCFHTRLSFTLSSESTSTNLSLDKDVVCKMSEKINNNLALLFSILFFIVALKNKNSNPLFGRVTFLAIHYGLISYFTSNMTLIDTRDLSNQIDLLSKETFGEGRRTLRLENRIKRLQNRIERLQNRIERAYVLNDYKTDSLHKLYTSVN